MTNVPSPTFGPNGFIIPTEAAVLAGVQADLNAAFNVVFNFGSPTNPTPQGQLSQSYAAIIGNTNGIFLYYTTQVDPAYSIGRMQDAIGRIYFMSRLAAEPTVLQIDCTGLDGVLIPVGALITDGTNIYSCTTAGTIQSGTVTLPFAALVPGPITVPVSVSIYQALPGWSTVAVASGVVGRDVESSSAFEARRAASVAANSNGQISSIRGTVLAVPGVTDAYVVDNPAASPATIGGVSVAAHSVYVSVVGGSNADVAAAIWSKKAPGCNYNGNTTVLVEDTNSGYVPPLPSYNVTFERPVALPIFFAINIVASSSVPSDVEDQVRNAVLSAFGGGDGGPKAAIGSVILANRFVSPIVLLGPWAQVRTIFIGVAASPTGTSVTVNLDKTPTLIAGNIAVTVT